MRYDIFFSIKIKIKERKFSFSSNNIVWKNFSMNFVLMTFSFFFNLLHIFSVHLMHADASSWKIFVCRLAKIAKSNSQLIIYTQTCHSGIKKIEKWCNKKKFAQLLLQSLKSTEFFFKYFSLLCSPLQSHSVRKKY